MITIGIIESLERTTYNITYYRVRMPVFHGISASGSNLTTAQLPKGYYCPLPHMEKTQLSVGDEVYVGLVDLSIDEVIILGLVPKTGYNTSGYKYKFTGSADTKSSLTIDSIEQLAFNDQAIVNLPASTKYYINKATNKYLTSSDLQKLSDIDSPIQQQLNNLNYGLAQLQAKLITKMYDFTVTQGSAQNLSITQLEFEKAVGLSSGDYNVKLQGIKNSDRKEKWTVWNGSVQIDKTFNSLKELGVETTSPIQFPCTIIVNIKEELNLTTPNIEGSGLRTIVDTGSVIPYTGGSNVVIGHAASSRNKPSPGDQSQTIRPDSIGEVCMTKYEESGTWMKVFRCNDRRKRLIMANRCVYGCNNNKIGYVLGGSSLSINLYSDTNYNKQYTQHYAFKDAPLCVTDCCNFMNNLVYSVGCGLNDDPSTAQRAAAYKLIINSYTGTQENAYVSTGEFSVLSSAVAQNPSLLKIGDILWRRSAGAGHTAMVVEVPASQDCWELTDGTTFNPAIGEVEIGFNPKGLSSQSSQKQTEGECILPTLLKEAEYEGKPSDCWQLIVVKANFTEATMKRKGSSNNTTCEVYSFEKVGTKWKNGPIKMCNGHIGSKGTAIVGTKREGDKKTPKGLYSIIGMFGSQPASSYVNDMGYFQITANDIWIDDVKQIAGQQLYNHRINLGEHEELIPLKDTFSYENMKAHADNGYYNYGLIINYNNPKPGLGEREQPKPVGNYGSAIFMHSGDVVTSGCVAVPSETMAQYLEWLDSTKNPHILIY